MSIQSLGEMVIKITGQNAEFDTAIDKSKKKMDSFGDSINTIVRSLGAAGLSASLLKVGKDALKVSGDFQMFASSFETMLGSSTKATKMLSTLQTMAAKTPFELKDLADGTKTLLQFNVAQEKVIPTLQALGDISQGNAQRFGALTLAFGQATAAGRLMGQDLMQMINAGFNPLQEISRKTGEKMADLKVKLEKGAISAEMLSEAFKSATSQGGTFFDGMSKASQTLPGLLSTLNDDLTMLTKSFGDLFIDDAMEAVKSLSSFVQTITNLDPALKTSVVVVGAAGAAILSLTAVVGGATVAFSAMSAVISANPFILAATGVAALVTALVSLKAAADVRFVNEGLADVSDRLKESAENGENLVEAISRISRGTGLAVSVVAEQAAKEGLVTDELDAQVNALVKANEIRDKERASTKDTLRQNQLISNALMAAYNQHADLKEVAKNISTTYGISLDRIVAIGMSTKEGTKEYRDQLTVLGEMIRKEEDILRIKADQRFAGMYPKIASKLRADELSVRLKEIRILTEKYDKEFKGTIDERTKAVTAYIAGLRNAGYIDAVEYTNALKMAEKLAKQRVDADNQKEAYDKATIARTNELLVIESKYAKGSQAYNAANIDSLKKYINALEDAGYFYKEWYNANGMVTTLTEAGNVAWKKATEELKKLGGTWDSVTQKIEDSKYDFILSYGTELEKQIAVIEKRRDEDLRTYAGDAAKKIQIEADATRQINEIKRKDAELTTTLQKEYNTQTTGLELQKYILLEKLKTANYSKYLSYVATMDKTVSEESLVRLQQVVDEETALRLDGLKADKQNQQEYEQYKLKLERQNAIESGQDVMVANTRWLKAKEEVAAKYAALETERTRLLTDLQINNATAYSLVKSKLNAKATQEENEYITNILNLEKGLTASIATETNTRKINFVKDLQAAINAAMNSEAYTKLTYERRLAYLNDIIQAKTDEFNTLEIIRRATEDLGNTSLSATDKMIKGFEDLRKILGNDTEKLKELDALIRGLKLSEIDAAYSNTAQGQMEKLLKDIEYWRNILKSMTLVPSTSAPPLRGYATGTDGAAPGLAWVGERGKELVIFNGGETVIPNHEIHKFETAGIPGYAGGTGDAATRQRMGYNKDVQDDKVVERIKEFERLKAEHKAETKRNSSAAALGTLEETIAEVFKATDYFGKGSLEAWLVYRDQKIKDGTWAPIAMTYQEAQDSMTDARGTDPRLGQYGLFGLSSKLFESDIPYLIQDGIEYYKIKSSASLKGGYLPGTNRIGIRSDLSDAELFSTLLGDRYQSGQYDINFIKNIIKRRSGYTFDLSDTREHELGHFAAYKLFGDEGSSTIDRVEKYAEIMDALNIYKNTLAQVKNARGKDLNTGTEEDYRVALDLYNNALKAYQETYSERFANLFNGMWGDIKDKDTTWEEFLGWNKKLEEALKAVELFEESHVLPKKAYATGTNSAAPGVALVGEKGPELVKFSGGEVVIPNDRLKNIEIQEFDYLERLKILNHTRYLEVIADLDENASEEELARIEKVYQAEVELAKERKQLYTDDYGFMDTGSLVNTDVKSLSKIVSNIAKYANGTSGAKPGFALVGERGPEIVKFNGGETVIPNHKLKDYNIAGLPGYADGTPPATVPASPAVTSVNLTAGMDPKAVEEQIAKINAIIAGLEAELQAKSRSVTSYLGTELKNRVQQVEDEKNAILKTLEAQYQAEIKGLADNSEQKKAIDTKYTETVNAVEQKAAEERAKIAAEFTNSLGKLTNSELYQEISALEDANKAKILELKKYRADAETLAKISNKTKLEIEKSIDDEIVKTNEDTGNKIQKLKDDNLDYMLKSSKSTLDEELRDIQEASDKKKTELLKQLKEKLITEKQYAAAIKKVDADAAADADKAKKAQLAQLKSDAQQIASAIVGLLNDINSLISTLSQNQIAAVEKTLAADLAALDKINKARTDSYGLASSALEAYFNKLKLYGKQEELDDLRKQTLKQKAIESYMELSEDQLKRLRELALEAGDQETADSIAQAEARKAADKKYENDKINLANAAAQKKYEIEKSAFENNKAISITNAIIGTALAVVNAWTTPVIGPILAAIAAAAGAVQIATIAAQQPPEPPTPTPNLAKGGVVLPRAGGQLVNVAEAGQAEAIIPLNRLNEVVNSTQSLGPSTLGLDSEVPIKLTIQLDKDIWYKGIFKATQNRSVLISSGALV